MKKKIHNSLDFLENLCKLRSMKKEKVVIHTFDYSINLYLDGEQRTKMLKRLNMFYYGDECPNKIVDGKYVPKYPEIEENHPEILEAHYNIRRSNHKKIQVELLSDGTLRIKK